MASHENKNELLEAQKLVWKHSLDFITTASLQSAVQLGLPDIIYQHGQPMTLSELISNLNVNPSKACFVARLMRFLIHSGFFAQQKTGYTLTLAGRFLLKDGPFAMTSFLHPNARKVWEFLADWFKNDDPTVFHTAFGKPIWENFADDPEQAYLFNQSMVNDSNLVTDALINDCKHVFEGLTSLVDVGGGEGAVARAIAEAFPDLKCTVLDQAHVIGNLEGTENLDFVAGDMFENIPPANAVLLKWILHDWPDEECVKILKKCKEAIIPSKDDGGKLIIIEMVIETDDKQDKDLAALHLSWDMHMMVLCAGKERNKEEWEKLFLEAGFSGSKIIPALGLKSLIEVYP